MAFSNATGLASVSERFVGALGGVDTVGDPATAQPEGRGAGLARFGELLVVGGSLTL